MQQLCDKFANVVFTPYETDEVEIDLYLRDLFKGDTGAKALARLRESVGIKDELLDNKTPFNPTVLSWCANGLLHNTLLTNEKKAVLQDFLENDTVMREIADVLNMRWTDVKNWSWDAGDEGIPVRPKQQLNGKTRIHVDEDILQSLFLHYVGTQWSVSFKAICLQAFDAIWRTSAPIPTEEMDRRRFYLGEDFYTQPCCTLADDRRIIYRDTFFMSHLPSKVENASGYDADPNDKSGKAASHQIKQKLLRHLATELHLRRWLESEASIVQSDLQWYATGLPHSTLRAVMRFIGMSDIWIAFFTKFLESPLNMGPSISPDSSSRSAANQVRIRKRGVPIAHALEVFFGELVLFFMDLAVNQNTDMLLYRQHDDLWLCGSPKKCSMAWQTMQDFAKAMGVEFNFNKTGSVYLVYGEGRERDSEILKTLPDGPVAVDFLQLVPETGKWTIDQSPVDAHIKQLQNQLGACTSVLSWVQTWNSCIGRFFVSTFGEPAKCFGAEHVDDILKTHARMQQFLFSSKDGAAKSVTEHVKRQIAERFGFSDVPDAFFYMPDNFGGLGLKNPFIELFPLKDTFDESPEQAVRRFLSEEKEDYNKNRAAFDALGGTARLRRFRSIFPGESRKSDRSTKLFPNGIDTFMSFEDFVAWRESESSLLAYLYATLTCVPQKGWVSLSREISDNCREIGESLQDLEEDKKWLLQMYASELFEQCGGLSLVDKSLLPLGVLTVLKERKVPWQMVL